MRQARALPLALLPALLPVLTGCADDPNPSLQHGVPVIRTRHQTLPGLGAAQGVTVFNGRVYAFGDTKPFGVLKEYAYTLTPTGQPRLSPTGRAAQLTVGGVNKLNHPTGLALRAGLPVFLGNTVTRIKEGRIFCIDLERLLTDGTADHAILNETLDDACVQGCRPEYVQYRGRWLVATSDYGPGPNFVRLYDPARLATAQRTTEPGVLVAKWLCGPWVQSLHWVDRPDGNGFLVINQNQIEGRLWRLTVVPELTDAGFARARTYDIRGPRDELEGYAQIAGKVGLFITSSRQNNLTFAIQGNQER